MTPLAGPAAQRILAAALTLSLAVTGTATTTGAVARDEIRDQQWHLDFLDIDRAHEYSTGEDVIVGVIDTGVDGGHPDLAGRLLPGKDFSVEHLPDALTDRDGHGTAMAGLIAAHGRALGIAPDATVLPVRRSTYGTSALGSDEAIDWAVDHGATVLCLAFGAPTPYEGLETAIRRAVAHDAVVVAGVGNRPDEGPQYPAAYPGVVGAGGVDRTGDHAQISAVTPAAVLVAPAVDITSTGARNVVATGYRSGTGTSDATAIIAGVAALVRSRFPDLPASEVIHRMTYTADDRGTPGRDDEYGYGIVNPVAALTADVPPLAPAATPPSTPDTHDGVPLGPLVLAGTAFTVAVLILIGLILGRRRTRPPSQRSAQ